MDRESAADVRDPARLPTRPFRVTAVTVGAPVIDYRDKLLHSLRRIDGLAELDFGATALDDRTLEALAGASWAANLRLLVFAGGKNLTDAGTAHPARFANLVALHFSGSRISGAGLAVLAKLPNLRELWLLKGPGSAGLEHLRGTGLTEVNFHGTPITDAALQNLAGAEDLLRLDVRETAVTAAGVRELAAALPACRLEWSGGGVEPKWPPPDPAFFARQERPAPQVGVWQVGDGTILATSADTSRYKWLDFGRQVGDFELRMEVKALGKATLKFRRPGNSKSHSVIVLSTEPGALFFVGEKYKWRSLAKPAEDALRAFVPNGFNRFTIRAVGKRVTVKINGVTASDDVYPEIAERGGFTWMLNTDCTELNVRNLRFTDLGGIAPKPQPLSAAQFAALEWFFNVGGYAHLRGFDREFHLFKDVPRAPVFTQYHLLRPGLPLSDEELAKLADLPPRRLFADRGHHLTAARLEQLADRPLFQNVATLVLSSLPALTDPALAPLARCPRLKKIELWDLPRVTGTGFSAFAKHRRLEDVSLLRCAPSADGLREIARVPGLKTVWLEDDRTLTAAAVANLAGAPNLTKLGLTKMDVTDDWLPRLEGCKALASLTLTKTTVTAEGVKKLAAALPACQIRWDGGVIEPASRPLFNGTELAGWNGDKKAWRVEVEDGEVVGTNAGPAAYPTLVSERRYRDFELTFDARARSADPGATFTLGLRDAGGRRLQLGLGRWAGHLWRDDGGGWRALRGPNPADAKAVKPDDYNPYTLRVTGRRVVLTVNGTRVIDDDFDLPAEGALSWRLGKAAELRVRDARITDLGSAGPAERKP
jgi:hypothetical protein